MADIQIKEQTKGRRRSSRNAVRVDMTPMVDLGFLLITFFLFTANFSKPSFINFANAPKNPNRVTADIDIRNSITFILGKDGRVFYYQEEKKNLNDNSLKEISFDHSQVAKTVESAKANAAKKDIFTVVVKPTDDSEYKTMVDMLDELAITKSDRYGISELNDKEKELYGKRIQ